MRRALGNVANPLGGCASGMASLATPQLLGVLRIRPPYTETVTDDRRFPIHSAKTRAQSTSEAPPNEHRLPADTVLGVPGGNALRTGAHATERAAGASALHAAAKAAPFQPTLSVLPRGQSAGWDPAAVALHVACTPTGSTGIEVQRAGLQLEGQTVPLAACHCISYAVPRLGRGHFSLSWGVPQAPDSASTEAAPGNPLADAIFQINHAQWLADSVSAAQPASQPAARTGAAEGRGLSDCTAAAGSGGGSSGNRVRWALRRAPLLRHSALLLRLAAVPAQHPGRAAATGMSFGRALEARSRQLNKLCATPEAAAAPPFTRPEGVPSLATTFDC